jgi:hypothetical protein
MTLSSIKVFIIFLFASFSCYSQTWEAGLTGGALNYMGDLNQRDFLQFNHSAFGALVKRNFDGYWSLKLAVLKGKLSDDESKSSLPQERARNLSFSTPITEGSLQVEFNFFDYGLGFGQKRITPFLAAGLAITSFNPQAVLNNVVYDLKNYNTEAQADYSTLTRSIPVTFGVKYRLSTYLNVIGEAGFRNVATDYLDDVSGLYADPADLGANSPANTSLRRALADRSRNRIGVPGTQRGDFRKKDTYLFAGITLTYTFVSQKCPL